MAKKRRKRRYKRRKNRLEQKLSIAIVAAIALLTVSILIFANHSHSLQQSEYTYTPTVEVQMEEESLSYNDYDNSYLYYDNGFAAYDDDRYTSRLGVDVSYHNGNIDWASVKASGVKFAMIRVGYRGYDQGTISEDPYFRQNIEGAIAQGIDVGVYFFSQAINEEEAAEEAKFVIEMIHDYNITMPVVYDMEYYSGADARANEISRTQRTDNAVIFLENVKNAGYTPMIYASTGTYHTLFNADYLTEYELWIAEYNASCSYAYDYAIWQYSSTGYINGISTNVDLNMQYIPLQ